MCQWFHLLLCKDIHAAPAFSFLKLFCLIFLNNTKGFSQSLFALTEWFTAFYKNTITAVLKPTFSLCHCKPLGEWYFEGLGKRDQPWWCVVINFYSLCVCQENKQTLCCFDVSTPCVGRQSCCKKVLEITARPRESLEAAALHSSLNTINDNVK